MRRRKRKHMRGSGAHLLLNDNQFARRRHDRRGRASRGRNGDALNSAEIRACASGGDGVQGLKHGRTTEDAPSPVRDSLLSSSLFTPN